MQLPIKLDENGGKVAGLASGHSFLDTLPARLIGDKTYDSDRLDQNLADRYGIEMIAPHRGQRREPTQDGRPLRRYRSRHF